MKTQDFDFRLPQELIAQFPPEVRRASRLLTVDGHDGALRDRLFCGLAEFVQPHDLMVFIVTRVI